MTVIRGRTAAALLICLTGAAGAAGLPDPAEPESFPAAIAEQVLLGRDLFFDPVLSGNRNISCATCHHPALASGDAVSLSIGEGGTGLGPGRAPDPMTAPRRRIPRNAPALFNLGAAEFRALFHDGRVERDLAAPFGIRMPDGFALERPVASVLAAQALLPVTSPDEMAGQPGKNPVADAVAEGRIRGSGGAWALLAARVDAIPAYRDRFTWITGNDGPVHITDIGNAIGAFIAFEFRATDSPFDAFLAGDGTALTNAQTYGLSLFYGKARCASCHSGPYQTDHGFHALGIPPIGPGKGHGESGRDDHGRAAVTGNLADLYSFRTASLRNVTLTAPYGHNGAYAGLVDMIRHHCDPLTMLAEYDISKARLNDLAFDEPDTAGLDDFDEMLRIGMAAEIEPLPLSDTEIAAIVAFLHALEDESAAKGRLGVPASVPSGLPLDPVPPPPGNY